MKRRTYVLISMPLLLGLGIFSFVFWRRLPFRDNMRVLTAVQNNDAKTLTTLLDAGVDPNGKPFSSQTDTGFFTAFFASDEGDSPLVEAVARGNTGMVLQLLTHHADPNYACYIGTPLTVAVAHDNASMIDLLVKYGAMVNDSPGSSYAFQRAIIDGKPASVQALLRHGADPNMKWDNTSAVQYAKEFHPNLVTILRKAGAH